MQFRPVCAVVGLFVCLVGTPLRAQDARPSPPPLKTEGMYPRFAARGQMTVISVAVPSPEMVQSAEISPATGVTVAAIKGEGSGSEQNVGWWDITVNVANDAALGDRSLVLTLPRNHTAPVTVSIVTHAPSISALRIMPPANQSPRELRLTAADSANDLGDAPYLWFSAACGGDPIVGVLRGKVAAGVVTAALPNVRLAAHDGIPGTGKCDLQVRLTDSMGIESNTLTASADFR